MSFVWKLEFQQRGAPHFHLLLLVPEDFVAGMEPAGRKFHQQRRVTIWRGGKLAEFRTWVRRSWYGVVKSGDVKHLQAGADVEPLEAWNKAVSYAAKYMGKWAGFCDERTGELAGVGRWWGVYGAEKFPVRWESEALPVQVWQKVRRSLRKWSLATTGCVSHALRGPVRDQDFFCSAALVQRLMTLYWPGFMCGCNFDRLWAALEDSDIRREPPITWGPDGPEWPVFESEV
jgi:hypothetical protein